MIINSITDYYQYLVLISGVFSVFMVAVYFIVFRNKIKVYILKAYRGGYRAVSFKRISTSRKKFSVGEDTYELNTKFCVETKRGTGMLFYEQGNAIPLSLKKGITASSTMLKKIIESGVYDGLFGNQKEKTLTILIIVLACALIGVTIFSLYIQMNLNERILQLTLNSTSGKII